MATQYGLTPQGFVAKPQSQIIAEIQASLQSNFGDNINLAPESVFGQIVGVFSEREALLWNLLEAIYASQYPNGAEGNSVDNILALNNLRRLPATSSTANLVLSGTPGTIIPAGSIAQTSATPALQFATNTTVTILAAVNAVQTLFFSSVPTLGAFTLQIIDPSGNTLTTGQIQWMSQASGVSLIQSLVAPTSGQFKINVNGQTTGFLQFNCSAIQVQNALQLLTGYGVVTVAGANLLGGFTITWTGVAEGVGRVAAITNSTLNQTLFAGNSVQSLITSLVDGISGPANPYANVTVTGSYTIGFVVTFAGTAGAQPQNLLSVPTNSLFNGSVAVNVNPVATTIGSPAQALVAATCTIVGPNFAPAGSINQIATPVAGWSGVTNPLDAVIGTNVETDTEALQRRTTLLSSTASGPLQSTVEKISQLSGVTSVVGFENLTNAGSQIIYFASVPVAGTFRIQLGGPTGPTTTALAFNVLASAVQAAINILVGYGDVIVTGNASIGFTLSFGSSSGYATQPLALIVSNSLGVAAYVVLGRPGKSFEIVVNYPGLPIVNTTLEQQIAQIIYDTKPAGIESFGSPILTTNGNTTAGSNNLTSVASTTNIAIGNAVVGFGIPINTFITGISGSTVTMSNPATVSNTAIALTFKTIIQITDAFENPINIEISKPQLIPIYIAVNLTVSRSAFPANGVQQIQDDMVAIGDALTIGGTVILFGTNGLVGAFNNVPGIVTYSLFAGLTPGPISSANIPLGPEQLALIESFNIICNVTVVNP